MKSLRPLLSLVSLSLVSCVVAAAAGCGSSESSSNGTTNDPTQPGSKGGTPGTNQTGGGAPAASTPNDINHVLGTGQSLSLGAMGTPALTREQPYDNLMFDTGLEAPGAPSALVPLVESNTFLGVPVETPSSSFANSIARRTNGQHPILMSLHGLSGASYPMVGKGTGPYLRGLAQVSKAKELATAQGRKYTVRAVNAVHGESDGWKNWNVDYDKALVEWQSAFEHDIKQITGQEADIPMFHSQYSAWTPMETEPTNVIPGLQLAAHKAAPGKVVLVGPKYQLPYAQDGFHLSNEGYRWLGEYYAKAYAQQVIEGKRWEPVRPKNVARSGASITITFFVPAPPLVLDTQLVADPGNFGFEAVDESGAIPIAKVAVTGPDTVTITLEREPSSSSGRIRYAWSGVPGKMGGRLEGPRGNLRDSDQTPSLYGNKLYDWCLHFEEAL